MKTNTAEVCNLFFNKVSEVGQEQLFKCNCGTQRKVKKGAGYTNLMSHLREKHPDWEELYNSFKKNNPKSKKAPAGHVFFVHPKVVAIHSWLEWITRNNLSINTVEKQTFRTYSHLESISIDTFTKYLNLVGAAVDANLREELPAKFGLNVDGWTDQSTHYFGVFAAYAKKGENYLRYITIAPPSDETNFTAHNPYNESCLIVCGEIGWRGDRNVS